MPTFNQSPELLLRMQREQHRHDKRNHGDIQCLHKGERLKHYGLHFCKYVGRLARGIDEDKAIGRTVVDTALVSLSAANTLSQKLFEVIQSDRRASNQFDPLSAFADAAGRFADACEKFDHLEDFPNQARAANADIFSLMIYMSQIHNVDLTKELEVRRKELRARAFYANED